ncbi:MAG TPA: peroxide stress protein YaaA, partial [Micromonospora sp.]
MLILLPPSEGKAATPRRGTPVDPAALSFPELGPSRERALDVLTELCGRPDDEPARAALGLSRHQGAEVLRNAALRRAPALPAWKVYTGVLYDALGLASLDQAARRRAYRSVLVFSGLWGVVRLTDRIPPYRCPVGATLPDVGALAGFWRGPLTPVLDGITGSGLVLDLRSAGYTGMWRPAGDRAGRTV